MSLNSISLIPLFIAFSGLNQFFKPKHVPDTYSNQIGSIDPVPIDHSSWNALLKVYVKNGRVAYNELKKAESQLDKYLETLKKNHPDDAWSESAALAFWINAYNAFTIKMILEHYPVSSIKDIHGGNPWDVLWIKIGKELYSLNQIENEIIRVQFKEPRIHFALVCAAKSCPPLASVAFTSSNMESKLHQLTNSFLNDMTMNKISPSKLELSQLFNWYAEDFGDPIEFIQKYTDVKIQRKATISFIEYDWSLNN
ncbi:MAG TPA: DUF547 domain-containing protein [Saprospiraceae bacterium]|nr:DUF547 domain-containing protein [Saprospiraceae bacterium]